MQSILISSTFEVPFSIHVLILTHTLNITHCLRLWWEGQKRTWQQACGVSEKSQIVKITNSTAYVVESANLKSLCVSLFISLTWRSSKMVSRSLWRRWRTTCCPVCPLLQETSWVTQSWWKTWRRPNARPPRLKRRSCSFLSLPLLLFLLSFFFSC